MSLLKVNLAVLLTVLASTTAFAFGLLLPGMEDLRLKERQIDSALEKVRVAQSAVGDVSELYSSILSLNEEMSSFRKKLPAERQFGEFLNALSQCLERSGISDYNIQPKQAETLNAESMPEKLKLAAGTTILPVSVIFEARFGNVFEFLDCVESIDRIVHLDSITLSNHSENPGWIRAEIELQTYHRAGD